MVFSNNVVIPEPWNVVLCLLKMVWRYSSVRLCNWYLINCRNLVLDCLYLSKAILILCEDTCMLLEQSFCTFDKSIVQVKGCLCSCSVVDFLTNTIYSFIETLKVNSVFSIHKIIYLMKYSYSFVGLKPDLFISDVHNSYMKLPINYMTNHIYESKVSWILYP